MIGDKFDKVRSRLFGPLLLDAVGCESAPVYGCRTQPGACLALANDCRESDAGTWRRNSTDALTAPLPSSGGHVKEQWCGHQRGQPDSRARGWAGLSLHDKPRSVLHEEPRPLPVSYRWCTGCRNDHWGTDDAPAVGRSVLLDGSPKNECAPNCGGDVFMSGHHFGSKRTCRVRFQPSHPPADSCTALIASTGYPLPAVVSRLLPWPRKSIVGHPRVLRFSAPAPTVRTHVVVLFLLTHVPHFFFWRSLLGVSESSGG